MHYINKSDVFSIIRPTCKNSSLSFWSKDILLVAHSIQTLYINRIAMFHSKYCHLFHMIFHSIPSPTNNFRAMLLWMHNYSFSHDAKTKCNCFFSTQHVTLLADAANKRVFIQYSVAEASKIRSRREFPRHHISYSLLPQSLRKLQIYEKENVAPNMLRLTNGRNDCFGLLYTREVPAILKYTTCLYQLQRYLKTAMIWAITLWRMFVHAERHGVDILKREAISFGNRKLGVCLKYVLF